MAQPPPTSAPPHMLSDPGSWKPKQRSHSLRFALELRKTQRLEEEVWTTEQELRREWAKKERARETVERFELPNFQNTPILPTVAPLSHGQQGQRHTLSPSQSKVGFRAPEACSPKQLKSLIMTQASENNILFRELHDTLKRLTGRDSSFNYVFQTRPTGFHPLAKHICALVYTSPTFDQFAVLVPSQPAYWQVLYETLCNRAIELRLEGIPKDLLLDRDWRDLQSDNTDDPIELKDVRATCYKLANLMQNAVQTMYMKFRQVAQQAALQSQAQRVEGQKLRIQKQADLMNELTHVGSDDTSEASSCVQSRPQTSDSQQAPTIDVSSQVAAGNAQEVLIAEAKARAKATLQREVAKVVEDQGEELPYVTLQDSPAAELYVVRSLQM